MGLRSSVDTTSYNMHQNSIVTVFDVTMKSLLTTKIPVEAVICVCPSTMQANITCPEIMHCIRQLDIDFM